MADIAVDPFTWSSTAGNNQPSGSTVIGTGLDDNFRAVQAGVKSALEPLSGVSGTNTITATSATLTAYASGNYLFVPANTNTGAVTLNINSLGAKNVYSGGLVCVGGELKANVPVIVSYDGTKFNVANSQTGAFVQKHIAGLVISNNGSDAVNDIDISAGSCRDAGNAYNMVLAASLTKQLDAAWAVGTNQGGLDTGAIANADYYVWLIARSDTGVVDALFSLSSTAPTMPSNYDYKRLIGWIKRSGATIVAFTAYETGGGGLEYLWSSPTLDVSLANTLTTSRRTDAVKVPLNFSTSAILNVSIFDGASGNIAAYIYCPDQADLAPALAGTPLSTTINASTSTNSVTPVTIRTSSTGTIAARATLATVDAYYVVTLGFQWGRRN